MSAESLDIEFSPILTEAQGFIGGRTLVINLLKIWTIYFIAVFFILMIFIFSAGLSVANIFSTDVFKGIFSLMAFSLASAIWTQLLIGLCLLGALYLSFINIFKRVRDIRGTSVEEFAWKAATLVLCFTPSFNFLFLAILFVKEGRLSSPNTAISIDELLRSSTRDLNPVKPKQD